MLYTFRSLIGSHESQVGDEESRERERDQIKCMQLCMFASTPMVATLPRVVVPRRGSDVAMMRQQPPQPDRPLAGIFFMTPGLYGIGPALTTRT